LRALILAAGLGTRLRPLTLTTPKCLAPIHGKPLLDYWFDLLFSGGQVSRALVNTSYLAEQVRDHVAGSRWAGRVDLVHEDLLLGTGGTVLANRAWFGEGPFIVAHGDNLTLFDVAAFCAHHQRRPEGVEITMMTFATDTPSSCGIVETDSVGRVRAFHEKVENPPGNNANAAVYIFEPAVVDHIASLGKPAVDISTEILPAFLGKIMTFSNTAYHRDIGTMESLAMAQKEFPSPSESA
jgi:mannose-1-phosphate guanylyltransferase